MHDQLANSPAYQAALLTIDWRFGKDRAAATHKACMAGGELLTDLIRYAEKTIQLAERFQQARTPQAYPFPEMRHQQEQDLISMRNCLRVMKDCAASHAKAAALKAELTPWLNRHPHRGGYDA